MTGVGFIHPRIVEYLVAGIIQIIDAQVRVLPGIINEENIAIRLEDAGHLSGEVDVPLDIVIELGGIVVSVVANADVVVWICQHQIYAFIGKLPQELHHITGIDGVDKIAGVLLRKYGVFFIFGFHTSQMSSSAFYKIRGFLHKNDGGRNKYWNGLFLSIEIEPPFST